METTGEQERLDPAIVAYLRELPALISSSKPSLFWERQLAPQKSDYARATGLGAGDIQALVRDAGYGFEFLPEGVSAREESSFRRVLDLIAVSRTKLRGFYPAGMGLDKHEWEHMRALDFLERDDLLEGYLAFLSPLGIKSSMSVARHWYYARQIDALAGRTVGNSPLSILEIGAGAGNLGCFLAVLGRVARYCVVDLPQMLIHSAYTAQRLVKGARLTINDPQAMTDTKPSGPSFLFLSPDRVSLLPDDGFDVCLNLNSFMEMDRDVRDHYFDLIYRVGRVESLFFNVNRRQRALPLRDGGTWDNNPLLYPYRADDQVLVWEEDPFQTATRASAGRAPSLAVTRAAVIRKGHALTPGDVG